MPNITSGPYDGKTPYDDEPDWIEEAEFWLKRNDSPTNEDQAAPVEIIKGLLQIMENEGVI